jgi:hypothetical protein
MNRTQTILGAALVLQLALILLVRSPFAGTASASEARPLLPGLEAITARRLELRGAEEEETVVLERGADGWKIPSLEGFPADRAKIEQLLESLSSLEVRRPIVRSSRYHDAFRVTDDDPEARVRVWGDGGEDPAVDLVVGSSPNYRAVHVRRAGDDDVYEVQGLASYDLRASESAWIRKELLEAPQPRIDHLVLVNAKGRIELRREDGTWRIVEPASAASTALDAGKVDSLVSAALGLRLADAVGPVDVATHGLAAPAAELTLGWTAAAEDGSTESSGEVKLEIGAPVADNASQRYVTREGFGYAGTVWESSVKRLLDDGLDAFTAAGGESG